MYSFHSPIKILNFKIEKNCILEIKCERNISLINDQRFQNHDKRQGQKTKTKKIDNATR